jgi:hypothetical protein
MARAEISADRHGQFHRHAALKNVLQRLLEDGIATDQGGRQSYYADAMKRLPQVEPNRRCRECYEDDTENLDDLKAVFVVMIVFGR